MNGEPPSDEALVFLCRVWLSGRGQYVMLGLKQQQLAFNSVNFNTAILIATGNNL